ncbi:hypothetical protein QLQ12_16955 [Actinoplanes sp. NEAU-A12]|uniref:DUF3558 domain-containing protein n=1 Tax=Actinoplanes sandaracinus TaxID=3045177 RepID=A0ABT6WKP6_9ACTN|nr:hypothetical protein [Actinoplanes sandaracinus]MDI6100297.1 hypothetical protein [Actinoplanes sandaracinus]
MIYTVRPVIAVTLLSVALLSACDSGDSKGPDASSSSSSSAKPRWQKLAAECPAFAGDAATGVEPVDKAFRPFNGKKLYAVGCDYRASESRGWKVMLNVTLYRTPVGERTPDALAARELDRNRRAAEQYATEGAKSEVVTGVGDSAFARLVPGRGVRVYVQTANAMVQLDYADPGDSRKALAKATDLTRQTLSVLR